MKDQKKTGCLADLLRLVDDGFNTKVNRAEIRHMVSPEGENHVRVKVCKKLFNAPDLTSIPLTKESVRAARNLLGLRALGAKPRDIFDALSGDADGKDLIKSLVDYKEYHTRLLNLAHYVHLNAAKIIRDIDESDLAKFLKSRDLPYTSDIQPGDFLFSSDRRTPDPVAALLSFDRLRSLEAAKNPSEFSPDDEAQRAYELFEMGCFKEASSVIASVLQQDPWHGMGNYVQAMMLNAEAVLIQRDAEQKQFLSEITDGFASDSLEDEALQKSGQAAVNEQTALFCYLVALRHWPKDRQDYDHTRRRSRVLGRVIGQLANIARDRPTGSGLGLQNLTKRLGTQQAPDLDGWLPELLRAEEPSLTLTFDRVQRWKELCWLELYRVCCPQEYARFGQQWLKSLGTLASIQDYQLLVHNEDFYRNLLALVPDVCRREEVLKTLHTCAMEILAGSATHAQRAILKPVLQNAYVECRLEEALELADRMAALTPTGHSRERQDAVYIQIRIRYDLALKASQQGDWAAAVTWLKPLAAGLLEPVDSEMYAKSYLQFLDDDEDEFEDGLGNRDDILDSAFEDSSLLQQLIHDLLNHPLDEPEKNDLQTIQRLL